MVIRPISVQSSTFPGAIELNCNPTFVCSSTTAVPSQGLRTIYKIELLKIEYALNLRIGATSLCFIGCISLDRAV